MKAIVCKEFGPPSSLVYEDVELPEPVSYTHLTLPTNREV